jgi:hypothetical protein
MCTGEHESLTRSWCSVHVGSDCPSHLGNVYPVVEIQSSLCQACRDGFMKMSSPYETRVKQREEDVPSLVSLAACPTQTIPIRTATHA